MSNWKEKILGEIGFTYAGLSGKTQKDFGRGKPFIPFMNIMTNGKIDSKFMGLVEVAPNERQNAVQKGDLFFTTSSETPEEVGMTSVLLDDVGECYLNSFCFGFRLYNFDDLLPEFAPYLFRGNEVRKQIINLGQGYTRFNLPKTELLKKLILELPSIREQKKISEILTKADSIIEKTRAAIDKYKAIKQGMLHDLFTRGIDLQTGKLRPRYQDAPHLYKESKLGWIPREWEVKVLGNLVSSYSGGTPSRGIESYYKGDIPWVTSSEVNQDEILKTNQHITQDALDNSSAKWVEPNTVLVAMYGATAGQISMLRIRATTNQAVLACPSLCEISSDFLYYLMVFNKENLLNKTQGTGQPNLSKSIIDALNVVFPKPNEQQKIAKSLKAIDNKLQTEQSYLQKMQSLKKGLMEDLLSGRKQVIINEAQ